MRWLCSEKDRAKGFFPDLTGVVAPTAHPAELGSLARCRGARHIPLCTLLQGDTGFW